MRRFYENLVKLIEDSPYSDLVFSTNQYYWPLAENGLPSLAQDFVSNDNSSTFFVASVSSKDTEISGFDSFPSFFDWHSHLSRTLGQAGADDGARPVCAVP